MQKPSDDSPQLETKWLNSDDFEFLCFDLAREAMAFNEPIPDYATRDDALLQSALGCPLQMFDNQLLYPTLIEQGAILFYTLIKNHPFQNGNKRVGVMSLLAFLSLNKKWLSVDPVDLYEVACDVSSSDAKDRDQVIINVEELITKNIISLSNNK